VFFRPNKYISFITSVILLPLSGIYYIIIRIRHLLYDSGILSSYKPDILTISVGNIITGGAGKTPFVIRIAQVLAERGMNPFVVTRGYGRRTSGRIIVNDEMNAETTGDEALTIFRKSGVPVICDPDRVSAVSDLGEKYGAAVLDDAFQHRRIRKDLDIVLIDHNRFLGNGLVLPSGILRDCISRLKRCDMIILTKIPDLNSESVSEKINYLKKFGKPVFLSQLKYTCLNNGNITTGTENIRSQKISVFCGIADPEPFLKFFDGLNIVSKNIYGDHYAYGPGFNSTLASMKAHSDVIVTTFKDFVKLSEEQIRENNVFYLDFEPVLYNDKFENTDIFDIVSGWISAEK